MWKRSMDLRDIPLIAYIAEAKRKLGLIMYDASNATGGLETTEETSVERKGRSDNGCAIVIQLNF